jgi:hypothetical protein
MGLLTGLAQRRDFLQCNGGDHPEQRRNEPPLSKFSGRGDKQHQTPHNIIPANWCCQECRRSAWEVNIRKDSQTSPRRPGLERERVCVSWRDARRVFPNSKFHNPGPPDRRRDEVDWCCAGGGCMCVCSGCVRLKWADCTAGADMSGPGSSPMAPGGIFSLREGSGRHPNNPLCL